MIFTFFLLFDLYYYSIDLFLFALKHKITTKFSTMCITGVVQFLSSLEDVGMWGYDKPLQFHDALYFTVVTLTTVGYGVYLNIGEQPGIMI